MTKRAVAFIRLDESTIQHQSFYMTIIQQTSQSLNYNLEGFCMLTPSNNYEEEKDIFDIIHKQTMKSPSDYDVILILSREAISTDVFKQHEFVEKCKELNIEVRSAMNLSNDLVETIMEEKEKTKNHSQELLAKSREGMFELAKKGVFLGGQPPFGCLIGDDKHLTIDNDYREIIIEIFTLYSRGLTLVNIARYLWDIYELGNTHNPRKDGNRIPYIKTDKLYAILTNPLYAGYPSYHRTKKVASKGGKTLYLPSEYWIVSSVKIERLSLISEELFDTVQKRIENDEAHKRLQIPLAELDFFLKQDVFLDLQEKDEQEKKIV